jgi:prepilin peptidase dependent protein B
MRFFDVTPSVFVSPKRGLSLVEFMVGIVVGLIVVGGAVKLFADYAVSNKRLMIETRVNQDLRAAADIVARDLRRAGYWNEALTGIGASAVANPHAPASGISWSASSVGYSYARAVAGNTGGLDSNEFAGFRLQNVGGVDVLQMQDGQANWQAITDPGTIRITSFTVAPKAPAITNDLSSYCSCLARLTCTPASIAASASGPPTLTIESFDLSITGQAVNDPAISRTVSETIRVRNPRLSGACPP